jgi:hypothetical protein
MLFIFKAVPVVILLMVAAAIEATTVRAHEPHVCPSGINDAPALQGHLNQADILKLPFSKIFAAGQAIFVANFNI